MSYDPLRFSLCAFDLSPLPVWLWFGRCWAGPRGRPPLLRIPSEASAAEGLRAGGSLDWLGAPNALVVSGPCAPRLGQIFEDGKLAGLGLFSVAPRCGSVPWGDGRRSGCQNSSAFGPPKMRWWCRVVVARALVKFRSPVDLRFCGRPTIERGPSADDPTFSDQKCVGRNYGRELQGAGSIGSTFAFHGRQNIRRSIRFRTTQNALVVSGRCGPRLSFFLVWSAALRAPCPRSQCMRVPLSLGFPSGIIR